MSDALASVTLPVIWPVAVGASEMAAVTSSAASADARSDTLLMVGSSEWPSGRSSRSDRRTVHSRRREGAASNGHGRGSLPFTMRKSAGVLGSEHRAFSRRLVQIHTDELYRRPSSI